MSSDLPLPPGEPWPQNAPQPPGPPQFAAPPPKKKSKTGKIIALVVGGVLLLGIICVVVVVVFAANLLGKGVQNAKVGECMPASVLDTSTPVSDINKVDCGSAEAAHRVVGILDNKTRADYEADAEATLCNAFPTAESILWIGAEGQAGKIFCLEPVKK